MGLDLYAYKVNGLTKQEVNTYNGGHISELPGNVLTYRVEDADSVKYRDLEDLQTPITLNVTYINMNKIRKDNGISEDAVIIGEYYGPDGVAFHFKEPDEKESKRISLTSEDVQGAYALIKTEDMYAVWLDMCGHWKNNDDLADEMEALYGDVMDNCGYHKCNDDMINTMMEDDYADGMKTDIRGQDNIFFCEWY